MMWHWSVQGDVGEKKLAIIPILTVQLYHATYLSEEQWQYNSEWFIYRTLSYDKQTNVECTLLVLSPQFQLTEQRFTHNLICYVSLNRWPAQRSRLAKQQNKENDYKT
jgi:hypothetical protein